MSDPNASSKAKLLSQIKLLRENLVRETERYKSKSKDSLNETQAFGNKTREEIKANFVTTVQGYEKYSEDQLRSLKESLELQLDSLRTYTNQIVEDDELKLVNSLEASLTNVSDITSSQLSELQKLTNQVNEIASKSVDRSVEIFKERDLTIKAELSQELTINKDELSSKIVELQDTFRDEMNQKIEKVFMGVTMTKEGINGIIRDTLSRLEENLNRLTEGIDENFTKEVGQAQDLIHEYEGKLLQVIEETQVKYDQQMEQILDKHSKSTQATLDKLHQELNTFKAGILNEISGLTKEQASLVANATKQLENQISKSRADVIESHGTMKDELEKILTANKETLDEAITSLNSAVKTNVQSMEKILTEKISTAQNNFSEVINHGKKNTDTHVNTLQGTIKQNTQSLETEVEKN